MLPKASRSNPAPSAPLACLMLFLFPQLVESTLPRNSEIEQLESPSKTAIHETIEQVESSNRKPGIQDNSLDLGIHVQKNPQIQHSPDGDESKQNQQILNEIRQLRSQIGSRSVFNSPKENQRSEEIFNEELARLVQQENDLQADSQRSLRSSRENLSERDRFQSKPGLPSSANRQSMLAPMNSNARLHEYQSHRAQNDFFHPQEVNEHVAVPPKGRFEVRQSEKPESLRSMARRLDQIAADLEEAQMYRQADEIRGTAHELWKTARNNRFDR